MTDPAVVTCENARNHGEYVSQVAHQKRDDKAAERAERDKPGNGNGNSNGNGNGNGKANKNKAADDSAE